MRVRLSLLVFPLSPHVSRVFTPSARYVFSEMTDFSSSSLSDHFFSRVHFVKVRRGYYDVGILFPSYSEREREREREKKTSLTYTPEGARASNDADYSKLGEADTQRKVNESCMYSVCRCALSLCVHVPDSLHSAFSFLNFYLKKERFLFLRRIKLLLSNFIQVETIYQNPVKTAGFEKTASTPSYSILDSPQHAPHTPCTSGRLSLSPRHLHTSALYEEAEEARANSQRPSPAFIFTLARPFRRCCCCCVRCVHTPRLCGTRVRRAQMTEAIFFRGRARYSLSLSLSLSLSDVTVQCVHVNKHLFASRSRNATEYYRVVISR
ncbi:uncharacterized protein LOC116415753 [Nasonia vitripennis]|uniref:Uncharacterized protein n=1 Tax=Nasonia vitripennis TaxID=7425 RepID=A0A7M7PYU4_NASVI|nr:uncharacterized protein LOC116415753 [Nasonia vitripennis]